MKLEKVNFFFNNEKLQKILFSLKIRQKSKFVIPQNLFLLNFAKIVLEIIFLSLPIPATTSQFFLSRSSPNRWQWRQHTANSDPWRICLKFAHLQKLLQRALQYGICTASSVCDEKIHLLLLKPFRILLKSWKTAGSGSAKS